MIRFRELIDVDLRLRDQPVVMLVQAADRKWHHSGAGLHERGVIGRSELSERAAIIWRVCSGAIPVSQRAEPPL